MVLIEIGRRRMRTGKKKILHLLLQNNELMKNLPGINHIIRNISCDCPAIKMMVDWRHDCCCLKTRSDTLDLPLLPSCPFIMYICIRLLCSRQRSIKSVLLVIYIIISRSTDNKMFTEIHFY